MPVPRTVDWRTISEDDFNRLADALLVHHWNGRDGLRASSIEGKGGDGGIDVGVWRGDDLVHVFQLKFFPEGFSGYLGQTRKRQIRESFERVLTTHPLLPEWTLVVPSKVSTNEYKFTTTLAAGRKLRVHVLGATELDLLMARYPAINAWATNEPLIAALAEIGMQDKTVATSADLAKRARSLADRASAFSPYWGWRLTVDESYTEMALYAKRADAHLREPIRIDVRAEFSKATEDLRQKFLRAMDYGLVEPVQLPPEVVTAIAFRGAEWIEDEQPGSGTLEMRPVEAQRQVPIEVRAFSKSRTRLASIAGKTTAVSTGRRGFRLVTSHYDEALTLSWVLDREGGGSTLDLNVNITDKSPSLALPVLNFFHALNSADRLEVHAMGERVVTVHGGDRGLHGPEDWDETYTALIDDLAYLERELSVPMTVPGASTALDHINVRFARMMLEGRVAFLPNVEGFDFQLSGLGLDGIKKLVEDGAQQIRVDNSEFSIKAFGVELELGLVRMWHPTMTVVNGADVLAAVEEGRAEGFPVKIQPTDGTGVRAYMPDRFPKDSRIVPEAWGIPGIREHRGLATARHEAQHAIRGEQGNAPAGARPASKSEDVKLRDIPSSSTRRPGARP